jgi:hypothetical protein
VQTVPETATVQRNETKRERILAVGACRQRSQRENDKEDDRKDCGSLEHGNPIKRVCHRQNLFFFLSLAHVYILRPLFGKP